MTASVEIPAQTSDVQTGQNPQLWAMGVLARVIDGLLRGSVSVKISRGESLSN